MAEGPNPGASQLRLRAGHRPARDPGLGMAVLSRTPPREPNLKWRWNAMTRREFIVLAGLTIVAANSPTAEAVGGESSAQAFGGPTPNDKFYVTSYGGTPQVDIDSWRLRVSGLVKQPLTLSYGELRAMAPVHETLTLACLYNPPNGDAISNALWTGVSLVPILQRAGVSRKAEYAAMRAGDGEYT